MERESPAGSTVLVTRQGAEGLGEGGEGDVAVPAGERAALEVVQAEAGLQFPVVMLDPPPDLGQPDEFPDRGVFGQGGQPVVSRLVRFGRPFGQEPAFGQAAVIGAGDAPVGGADPDGQEAAGHRCGRVALGGPGALPPGHRPDLVRAGDRQRAQVRRRGGVGGLRRPAGPAAQGAGRRPRIARVRAGGALDRDRVPPAPVLQLQPEGGDVPVARIGGHHGPGAAGRGGPLEEAPPVRAGHLVDHLQRQPPLLAVPDVVGDAGPLAAAPRPGRLHRVVQGLVVPASRAEQPPVRRARGALARQVHAHPDLAVADLAQRPGILAGHARRRVPVFREAGVVDNQGLDRLPAGEIPRDVPPHRQVIPGRGRDELLQPLMIDPQPGRHRLHRLTLPAGEQPAHVQLPGCPLILARQPAEHLRGKIQQPGPDLRDLLRRHARITLQIPAVAQT